MFKTDYFINANYAINVNIQYYNINTPTLVQIDKITTQFTPAF